MQENESTNPAKLDGLRLLPNQGRDRAIAKVVKAFRKKQTPEQNAQWSDENIVEAFRKIENDPTFLDGLAAKQKMLDASSRDLSQQTEFLQSMGESAKLCAALYSHALKFWNVILRYERLGVRQGQFMQNAAKGCGLLETGGYGEEKIDEIDAHENVDGDKQRGKQRGEFVPGSGGSRVGVFGKEESFSPIFNVGNRPDEDDDMARRIREEWLGEKTDETD